MIESSGVEISHDAVKQLVEIMQSKCSTEKPNKSIELKLEIETGRSIRRNTVKLKEAKQLMHSDKILR